MAEQAQELLAGSGWLPEPLRTPGRHVLTITENSSTAVDSSVDQQIEEMAEGGDERAMAETGSQLEDEAAEVDAHAVAAE